MMLEEETRNEFVTRMQLPLKMVTIRKKLIIREFDSKEDVGVFKLCKSFIVFRWMLLGSVFVSSFSRVVSRVIIVSPNERAIVVVIRHWCALKSSHVKVRSLMASRWERISEWMCLDGMCEY